jgi:hypothetical protein
MLVNGHLRARKYLTVDSIIEGLHNRFEAIPDVRRASSVKHSQADCLMAAFAMFSLKESSLLAFDQRRQDESLMNLYRIQMIPSDTQYCEILDQVDPKLLNECSVYKLDHNYGHGRKNWSTVFAVLMFLAFRVDQVQQLSCPLFKRAMEKFNTHRAYWHHLRRCVESFAIKTWRDLYLAIIEGRTRDRPLGLNSS